MQPKIMLYIGLFVVAAGGAFLWQGANTAPQTSAIEAPINIQDTAGETDVDKTLVHEMVLGSEDAPVTIIEYASYTCPHCANFHETVFNKIKANYIDTGKVKFIMREVYFDRLGLWGAMLARCDESKYFGIADLLFTKQSEWTKGADGSVIASNLFKLGRLAGMTDEVMDACMQDSAVAQALVAVYQENAERDDISGTPSFIVNGTKQSNMNYDDFAKLLDTELGE